MESRVFWFIVTCVLCVDATGESIFTRVFTSINNASQFDLKTDETQTEQLIHTGSVATSRKNNTFDSEILHESPRVKELSVKTRSLSGFEDGTCLRYCVEQLGTGKNKPFEDINLFWSFAGSKSETDNFSLGRSPRLKISRRNDENSTELKSNCYIYLYLGCDIVNMERNPINQQEKKIPGSGFSQKKALAHSTNLSGYTETEFHVDANVTKIIINIRGNLTRAVLAIPTNRTMRRPGTTMSLARSYDTRGVTIDARNPPPGAWLVKLTGLKDSKYSLDVTGYKNFGANERSDVRDEMKTDVDYTSGQDYISRNEATATTEEHNGICKDKKESRADKADSRIDSIFQTRLDVTKKPKFMFERSADVMDAQTNTDSTIADDLLDASLSPFQAVIMKDIINGSILPDNSSASYGDVGIPQNVSNRAMFNERMLALDSGKQEQKIQTRSSEVASLNEDIDMNVKPFASNNVTMKIMREQELSMRLAGTKEEIFGKQKILIEVNPESSLIAVPGRIHTIVFDLTNNCVLTVRYAVRATSSSFRINNIRPLYVWLYPGQTSSVAVDIVVPAGIRQDTVNTLTLFVDGTEISEKMVYVYVRDPYAKINDNVRPTIEYSFNGNCAGNLNKDRCDKTFWSADITIEDPDSGLKSVTSTPNRIYPRTEFISGTKNSVTFYYLSTCCSTTATVTAIDLLNNEYSRKIDVTEWDNLSQGEIAAIVVGALLLLLLLILLIVAIVYCIRRRNSHDLSFTQRYGSRQPPRSERTSF